MAWLSAVEQEQLMAQRLDVLVPLIIPNNLVM